MRILALISSLAFVFSLSSVSAQVTLSNGLIKAAQDFGVELHTETFTSYMYSDDIMEGAIILGYESIAPTDYGDGVDMAIIRYHFEEEGVPDGYYKWQIRTVEPVTDIGDYTVISTLLDQSGKVVFEQESVAEVFSLTPLEDAPFPGVLLQLEGEAVTTGEYAFSDVAVRGVVCCKNGMCGQCVGYNCPQSDIAN